MTAAEFAEKSEPLNQTFPLPDHRVVHGDWESSEGFWIFRPVMWGWLAIPSKKSEEGAKESA